VILTLAFALSAQAERDPEEVLAKARDQVTERTERLPNYTCVQTVDRTYLKRATPEFPVPSCDRMSAERKRQAFVLKIEATDRLRLDVKVSAGNEIGSWAGASHFEEGNVEEFVKGPFGTGPFGTFLSDIFTLAGVSFNFLGEETVDGQPLFRYSYRVLQQASHYMVQAGADWHVTGYDGEIWIDSGSFELRRLLVRTSELPEETGACEATTTVEYAAVRLGAGDFLLPRRSDLHFLMRDTTASEIATAYSNCREFLGEAKMVAELRERAHVPPAAPVWISPGLPVSLELAQPIDSDTAAAGDVVEATVSKTVHDSRTGAVAVPAGSKIWGRIVRMEHWQEPNRYFLIALQLETIEINGMVSPFYAILKHGEEEKAFTKEASGLAGRGRPVFLRPHGQSALVATFVFTSAAKRYLMRRGFETKWTTVLAPRTVATR